MSALRSMAGWVVANAAVVALVWLSVSGFAAVFIARLLDAYSSDRGDA